MPLRTGAENKPKLYAAMGLGAVVLLLAIRLFISEFGSSPTAVPAAAPSPAAARVMERTTPTPSADSATSTAYPHEAIKLPSSSALDPTLHPEVMAQAEDTAYTGNGRNIFSTNSAAPPPRIEKPAQFRPSAPVVPLGPPPPPAIDLKFYGYSSAHGNRREIFLLRGDDIFLAHEGDVVDRRYRIVAIRPFAVEIEDIPYHNTQSVPLAQN